MDDKAQQFFKETLRLFRLRDSVEKGRLTEAERKEAEEQLEAGLAQLKRCRGDEEAEDGRPDASRAALLAKYPQLRESMQGFEAALDRLLRSRGLEGGSPKE